MDSTKGQENRGFELDSSRVTDEPDQMSASMETLEMRGTELPMTNISPKEPNILERFRMMLDENRKTVSISANLLIHALVIIYFGFATNHYLVSAKICTVNCEIGWCNGFGLLLIMMLIVYAGILYYSIKGHWGDQIYASACLPIGRILKRMFRRRLAQIIGILFILALFGVFLFFETSDDRDRLRSLLGIVVILLLGLVISKSPMKVIWRPVIFGVICQVLLGFFTIRWDVGRSIFECFGHKVSSFLDYAKEGAIFVYGKDIVVNFAVFAFSVLTVIYFFSLMISMLYYLGAMQWVVIKMGWVLQSILGTTVCESVNAAANIFLGQSESPLLIRPYIQKLTLSEMHAIMASGFATVSGSVLAAYITFGADPANLITASVMAAPASLCVAKLVYPETEESQTTKKNMEIAKSESSSLLDAATNGALQATELVLGIIANLIAFVSFIAFFNGILQYFGMLVGFEGLTMQFIMGKVFIPIAWLIGVRTEDCEIVARIIGMKSIINEFIAFEALGVEIANGLHPRSAAIATFAVCGFANPSSMGILIGSLSAMCPHRRKDITSVAFRAVISGTLVCFLTASIAGLLMDSSRFIPVPNNSTTPAPFDHLNTVW